MNYTEYLIYIIIMSRSMNYIIERTDTATYQISQTEDSDKNLQKSAQSFQNSIFSSEFSMDSGEYILSIIPELIDKVSMQINQSSCEYPLLVVGTTTSTPSITLQSNTYTLSNVIGFGIAEVNLLKVGDSIDLNSVQ